MFKLLKGGYCYTPEYLGKKDILIVSDKIYKIGDSIPSEMPWEVEILDCNERIICPGFIDQHVHITGGGGENGPASLIPEIKISDILSAGVTTVVGLLGFDSISKNVAGLLAKARALSIQGLTAYIYTGSYDIPTRTLTGKPSTDIVYINEIIGIGEIAISDHRSSHPTIDMLKEIAHEARMGGLISGKAGIVHIHVGDGKNGLLPISELIENSDFPVKMFVPTHVNRNRKLFEQAIEYNKAGGNIDLTSGEANNPGISVPDALNQLMASKGLDNVTVSSDGNGSIPSNDQTKLSVGKVQQLYLDIKQAILNKNLDICDVLKTVTSNPARLLNIYPKKGALQVGSDADILILDKNQLSIELVIAGGKVLMNSNHIKRIELK
jgi:beta-aspartyl-dipeptidase (metallo-type)